MNIRDRLLKFLDKTPREVLPTIALGCVFVLVLCSGLCAALAAWVAVWATLGVMLALTLTGAM